MQARNILNEFDVVLTTREQFQLLVSDLERCASILEDGEFCDEVNHYLVERRLRDVIKTLRAHVAEQREPLV